METTVQNTLSIVVPVYNERANLPVLIPQWMNLSLPIQCEWIFINDHSSDGSWEILQDFAKQYGFRCIDLKGPPGKGSAVRAGFRAATGDYIVIQDADFEYDSEDLKKLLIPLMEQRADVVYGSRFKKSSHQVHRTYHYFVNRFLTFLSNLLSGVYLTDMETCYKMFRREILQSMRLVSRRFEIEIEVTANIGKIKCRIYEVPISYFPRTRLQGKKINWKDGFMALYYLFKFNLFHPVHKAFREVPTSKLASSRQQSVPSSTPDPA